ncbi:ATP-dependent DNA helicase RecG [Candidatus Woesebacteria bacterium]|nr:ATP-dependent DNA helicase RecG [Candidatus Woesebacteria bacterium]
MNLTDPISILPKTHSTTIKRLHKIGIETVGDLVQYFPIRYADYSYTSPIGSIQAGETVTAQGKVTSSKTRYIRRNFTMQEVVLNDGTGEMKLIWFNQPYIITTFAKVDAMLAVAGKVELQGKKLVMKPLEYEQISNDDHDPANTHTGKIIPIYSQRGGLSTRLTRDKINYVLAQVDVREIPEWLPLKVVRENNLPEYSEALYQAHTPQSLAQAQRARARFAFDELFTLHLSNILIRKQWQNQESAHQFADDEQAQLSLNNFVQKLPFTLTGSQISVWEDMHKDMLANRPMNRFLQGDVGSGKTVVAALAAYFAQLNGLQTLFMCPTSILAEQHFATLKNLFTDTDVSVEIVTGSTKSKGVQQASIVVGTHALISEKRSFENVGLVIIDEQHRFGVAQRAILKNKSVSKASASPHLLTMTATPIPRTVALTLFGDLDISVLTDMPVGRLPIKTYLAPQSKRAGAYDWIRKQIKDTGCQVFVVCPRISDEDDEASENEETKLSVKAVETETELLKTKIFPDLRIAMLHGKMKPAEKNAIMLQFKSKEFDILVTTTVVEVGIDIPNATIMVIEGAERYGLAQLHQLRGRVGRSTMQSYCVLFTTDGANESERLSFFAKTNKGMELAEYDFRHRGPGNIYGTAQHGLGELQVANLFDFALVSATQKAAATFAETYTPKKYPVIAKRLEHYSAQAIARD